MNISKISNIVKSKNVQYDILGNSIAVGDIVAIAYHNNLYYGIVYEVTDRFVRAYDKKALDNGNNIQIGRAIVGRQCIVIHKLIDTEIINSIVDKQNENDKKEKEARKAIPKKIFLKWFDKRSKQYGFLITTSKSSTNKSLYETLDIVTQQYPNMMFSILNKDKEWINFDKDCKAAEIKFVHYYKGVISNNFENPSSYHEDFGLLNVPIVVQKNRDQMQFFIIDSYTTPHSLYGTYIASRIFKNLEKRDDDTINNLELDMEYIKSYDTPCYDLSNYF
jgi:hypothetical protein